MPAYVQDRPRNEYVTKRASKTSVDLNKAGYTNYSRKANISLKHSKIATSPFPVRYPCAMPTASSFFRIQQGYLEIRDVAFYEVEVQAAQVRPHHMHGNEGCDTRKVKDYQNGWEASLYVKIIDSR